MSLPPAVAKLGRRGARLVDAALVPRPAMDPRCCAGPTVAGLFGAASGIGASARLCFDALAALGLAPDAIDVSGSLGQDELPTERFGAGAADNHGPLIIHANPPELPRILRRIGAERLRGRRIVGYWAWELPGAPPSWSRAVSLVHEVWVPSAFCARAFGPAPRVPVRVVPHVLDRLPQAPAGTTAPFRVFAAGDLRSSLARKNLEGTVAAFRRAFGERDDAILVLKATHGRHERTARERIQALVDGLANVRLASDVLSEVDERAAIADADVVLSLHRAEGFGLVLAEAMLSGVPVVATAWSGNMEFMTGETACLVGYDLVPVEDPQKIYAGRGQRWAEPHIEDAVDWLVRLKEDPALRAEIGARAREGYPAERFRGILARTVADASGYLPA